MDKKLSLVYCRAGKSTAEKIQKSLFELLENRHDKFERRLKEKCGGLEENLTENAQRAWDFVKKAKKNDFTIPLISNGGDDYKDGEIKIDIQSTIREHDVFVVQNTLEPYNTDNTSRNIMELFWTISALKRSGAHKVSAIVPYLSYCKQERRKGREVIAAAEMIRMLEDTGLDRLITMDLHSSAVEGVANPKNMIIENLFASTLFIEYLEQVLEDDGIYVAPDAGAAKNVQYYAKTTGRGMAAGYKVRSNSEKHKIDEQELLGDVSGRNAAIIDDQFATGTTMVNIADKCKKQGAKKVYAAATHLIIEKEAEARLNQLYRKRKKTIDKLVFTDSLLHSEKFLNKWEKDRGYIKIITIMPFLARAMYELHIGGSLKKLYTPELQKELFGIINGDYSP